MKLQATENMAHAAPQADQTAESAPNSLVEDGVTWGGASQFSLRSLLVGVALVGASLALVIKLGWMWSSILFLFAALVGAHVIANARGARLSQARIRHRRDHDRDSPRGEKNPLVDLHTLPPTGSLWKRTSILLVTGIPVVLGAAIGGGLGAYALIAVGVAAETTSGLALGTGSAAVIGGFFGFLLSSFWHITSGAVREAALIDLPAQAKRRRFRWSFWR